jgi:polycystin 1L2
VSVFRNVVSSCEASYSMFEEEQRSFQPGWNMSSNDTVGMWSNQSKSINKAFTYTPSDQLDTYTYVGEHGTYGAGGYIYEFRGRMSEMKGNISRLRQLSWLDMQTRAVIIQMSLYNPNVNLFICVTLLVEFIPTGGLYPSARVEPMFLLNDFEGKFTLSRNMHISHVYFFLVGFALFKLICSIVYMMFIIYFMQKEIRSMIKLRMAYLRDFWSYPELGIIICSWIGFGVYIWRVREGDRVGELFKQNNGYSYVNLQLATYVNDTLTFLLGFCCFFGTIKFLRLLRFNQRMSMLQSTLAYAARDLLSFCVMFSVVYFGYLALFFLLFHSKIWACADCLRAAQMLFEMMLLKFDVSDLYAADVFLGPFCFTLFVIFVVFICMNMVSDHAERYSWTIIFCSSFPLSLMHSASFEITSHCKLVNMRSLILCSIN